MTPDYSCSDRGHVWREGQRPTDAKTYDRFPRFVRHRDRPEGRIPVFCQDCDAVADLEAHSRNVAPHTYGKTHFDSTGLVPKH